MMNPVGRRVALISALLTDDAPSCNKQRIAAKKCEAMTPQRWPAYKESATVDDIIAAVPVWKWEEAERDRMINAKKNRK